MPMAALVRLARCARNTRMVRSSSTIRTVKGVGAAIMSILNQTHHRHLQAARCGNVNVGAALCLVAAQICPPWASAISTNRQPRPAPGTASYDWAIFRMDCSVD